MARGYDCGSLSDVDLAGGLRVILGSKMRGFRGKEKIKINSDVSRAEMPVFIELLTPHAFMG